MSARSGEELVVRVASALEDNARARRVREVSTADWSWIEIDLHDERYPLTVDVLASKSAAPGYVSYMLPGGGVNFRAAYFSPLERNLGHFMRKHRALVIGVSPREDNVPANLRDYSAMAEWGLAKHRADLRSVVAKVQPVAQLPHELFGHSYGASLALDYAAHHSDELRRVIALDIYSVDPEGTPGKEQARATYAAHVQRLQQGVVHDTSYGGLKDGIAVVAASPFKATEFARAKLGLPGNFTEKGAFEFSLLSSALLPGIHTQLTGLPGDWPLQRAHLAGDYRFAEDPEKDLGTFRHTSYATLREAAAQIGGGIVPVAFERDYWAVNAGDGSYELRWDAIKCPVLWLNAEYGYAHHSHGAKRIREAGNPNVSVDVIPGYGHADLLWGDNAAQDVWKRLVS